MIPSAGHERLPLGLRTDWRYHPSQSVLACFDVSRRKLALLRPEGSRREGAADAGGDNGEKGLSHFRYGAR